MICFILHKLQIKMVRQTSAPYLKKTSWFKIIVSLTKAKFQQCPHLIERCVTYHRSSSWPSCVNLRRWRRSKPPGKGEFWRFILTIVSTIYSNCQSLKPKLLSLTAILTRTRWRLGMSSSLAYAVIIIYSKTQKIHSAGQFLDVNKHSRAVATCRQTQIEFYLEQVCRLFPSHFTISSPNF